MKFNLENNTCAGILIAVLFSLFIFFVSFGAMQAFAAEITWSWTAPTQREDGTPLAPEEIKGYEMKWGDEILPSLLTAGTNQVKIPDLENGKEWCASFRTVDTEDRVSRWTEPSCKLAEELKAPPGEPVSVTVEITQ